MAKITVYASILFIGIILAISIPVYTWTNSCAFLDDSRLHKFIADPQIISIDQMTNWVEREYGPIIWELDVIESSTYQGIRWRTPFKGYAIGRKLDGDNKIANVYFWDKHPEVGDILRCFGNPGYYEAYDFYHTTGDRMTFAMWFPQKGIRAGLLLNYFHTSTSILEEGFFVSDTTVIDEIHYVAPGRILQVMADVYTEGETASLLNFLYTLRVWQGIDKILYYIKSDYEWWDKYQYYPSVRVENRSPDKRFGQLIIDRIPPKLYQLFQARPRSSIFRDQW